MIRNAILALLAFISSAVFAGEAVSSAFTLDLHYESSGEVFPGDDGTEVWDISSRWTAMTTERASDVNSDGIPDWWELSFGLSVGSLASDGDEDADGFSNLFEYNAGMNPLVSDVLSDMNAVSLAHRVDTDGLVGISGLSPDVDEVWNVSVRFLADTAGWERDSDFDGLPDWFENLYGLDAGVYDSQLDADGDGFTNIAEYNAGTNPVVVDNWASGQSVVDQLFLCDTREGFIYGENFPSGMLAGFGLSGLFLCDTGGLYYDWDGDGIPNWWEARYSPVGDKMSMLAGDDSDGDGASNYAEFVAYTDPTNRLSRFIVEIAHASEADDSPSQPVISNANMLRQTRRLSEGDGSSFVLRWQSAKGRVYSVFSTHDLSKAWGSVPEVELEGSGMRVEWVPPSYDSAMFFKVKVRLSDDN